METTRSAQNAAVSGDIVVIEQVPIDYLRRMLFLELKLGERIASEPERPRGKIPRRLTRKRVAGRTKRGRKR